MKRVNPEYKHHEQLKSEHLNDFEHDENSKSSFNKKYNKFILPLLFMWLAIIPAFFILKFNTILLLILFPIPLILILILKFHQAKFSNALCSQCNAVMKKQDDPIVGAGQKLYTCDPCKAFFCISYAQKGQRYN